MPDRHTLFSAFIYLSPDDNHQQMKKETICYLYKDMLPTVPLLRLTGNNKHPLPLRHQQPFGGTTIRRCSPMTRLLRNWEERFITLPLARRE